MIDFRFLQIPPIGYSDSYLIDTSNPRLYYFKYTYKYNWLHRSCIEVSAPKNNTLSIKISHVISVHSKWKAPKYSFYAPKLENGQFSRYNPSHFQPVRF